MKRGFRLFIRFLKTELSLLFCCLGVFAIMLIVSGLYRMPFEGILYSALLIFCLCAVLIFVRFIIFCKRYSVIQSLAESVQAAESALITYCALDSSTLPEPASAMEEGLVYLLCLAADCIRELNDASKRKESEMGEYYTMWVHQIKTPITVMRLLLTDKETELAKKLSAELFRIEQYADMALTYTRLSDGSSDYVLQEYPIDTIARRAVRKYAPLFIAKHIAVNYQPLNITAVTDEKWLQFCIEQLLSNAVKYTDSGSVTISSNTEARGAALVIRDTGMGVAAEDIPRIFDMGYTGYNGRADKKSTGIGLYLCKKALNGLGHEIRVESVVGQGTCVSILFGISDTRYE